VGIYEYLEMSQALRELVLERASEARLAEVSREQGMKTLREECLALVVDGQTTLEEVLRLTQERR
jgi:type II secretory ATPase GspE/PulE/Tfp pilus assembly ATPase PilB-like protein